MQWTCEQTARHSRAMRRYQFRHLGSEGPEHIASKLIPGKRIAAGGVSFHAPGARTHPEGTHRHDHEEVFCILQGTGRLWIDGKEEPLHAGDVIVVDPGEEHYIYASEDTPTINCWFRADAAGNPKQYPAG
jgi:quercetin dioxygenase-like cupin family protein